MMDVNSILNLTFGNREKLDLSVVLCTRNRLDEVIRFTKSLYNQIILPSQYVIVDSSDTPLISNKLFVDMFNEMQNKIELHYIHSKPGLTKQRNIGVKKSRGDITYFFDDDIILEPEYLQIMNDTFKNNPDYMGGMGALIGLPEQSYKGRIMNLFRRFFLLQHDYGDGKFQKSGFPRHPYGANQFKEVEVLGGCCCCYKREVLNEFEFDENLTGYCYMEDVDFSRKVSYKYKLFYNPEAKVEHRHSSGGQKNTRENRKMYMLNHRYLFFKNFYSRNKLSVIPHWWSILGLIINSFIFESKEVQKGYIDGLKEFEKRKKELLCN